MDATTARTNIDYRDLPNEPTAGLLALQNVVLSELPGATFAVLTLVYVLTALIGL